MQITTHRVDCHIGTLYSFTCYLNKRLEDMDRHLESSDQFDVIYQEFLQELKTGQMMHFEMPVTIDSFVPYTKEIDV